MHGNMKSDHTWTIFWKHIFISAWVYVDSDFFFQSDSYPLVYMKLICQKLLHKLPSCIYNILTLVPINIWVILTISILHTRNVHSIINSCYAQLVHPYNFSTYFFDIDMISLCTVWMQVLLSSSDQFLSKKYPAPYGITCLWVYSWIFCTDIPSRLLQTNVLIASTAYGLSIRNGEGFNLVYCWFLLVNSSSFLNSWFQLRIVISILGYSQPLKFE